MRPSEQQLRFTFGVAVAQIIPLSAACGGTALELLGHNSRPIFIATSCFAIMALLFGSITLYQQGPHINLSWWKYALFELNDIMASYCIVSSLRYTSVTSWALIQPTNLFSVVPLSIWLLQASYNWRHLASGLLAFSGLVVLLLSDASGNSDDSDHSALEIVGGDLLMLLGSLLYGVNNTVAEYFVKGGVPKYEVLGMLGSFGVTYGIVGTFATGEIGSDLFPETKHVVYSAIAVASNFCFYALVVVVVQNAGTAIMGVSLLGVNFWSVLGKVFIIGDFHTNLMGFIFAVVMVVTGVTLFVLSGDPYAKRTADYTPLVAGGEEDEIEAEVQVYTLLAGQSS